MVEEAGKQVVLADNDSHRQAMLDDYQAFIDGRLQLSLSKRPSPGLFAALGKTLAAYPVTLILVALSIIGFFLVQFDNHFEIVFEQKGKKRQYAFDFTSGVVKKLINSSYCVEKMDCNVSQLNEFFSFIFTDLLY